MPCFNEQAGCSETIRRKDILRHMSDCKHFQCQGRALGCSFMANKGDVRLHEAGCSLLRIKEYVDKQADPNVISKAFRAMGLHGPGSEPAAPRVSHTSPWPIIRRITAAAGTTSGNHTVEGFYNVNTADAEFVARAVSDMMQD